MSETTITKPDHLRPMTFTLDWPHGWQTAKNRFVAVILKRDGLGKYPLIGYVRDDGRDPMTGYELTPPEDHPTAWDLNGASRDGAGFNIYNAPAPTVSVPADRLKYGYVCKDASGEDVIVIYDSPQKTSTPDRVAWFFVPEEEAKQ